jgi:hypothetical protein
MGIAEQILAERPMSSYPVSIGTSMALEKFGKGSGDYYDPNHQIKEADLGHYQEFWVNLLTIFRNVVSSIKTEHVGSLTASAIADTMADELNIIDAMVSQLSPKTTICYYSSQYSGMERAFPYALYRSDTTEQQRHYTKLAQDSLTVFYSKYRTLRRHQHFSLMMNPQNRTKALILTHMPIDLLCWKQFASLELLESHTGVIKPRSLWYTKYLDGKDKCQRIPWDRRMLQIFGDRMSFKPMDIKVRKEILDAADANKWTQATTEDRLSLGLRLIKDPYVVAILKKMV